MWKGERQRERGDRGGGGGGAAREGGGHDRARLRQHPHPRSLPSLLAASAAAFRGDETRRCAAWRGVGSEEREEGGGDGTASRGE